MRVGLFIPCYVDQLFPGVAQATLTVLESFGIEVFFPLSQTCCGQPLSNSGFSDQTEKLTSQLLTAFQDCDFIVSPSGSCVSMVKNHSHPPSAQLAETASRFRELCEFLYDELKVESLSGSFPHSVGLHQGCHGLRELRLAGSSERMEAAPNKALTLLASLRDIRIVELSRRDECCGFGGTFAVSEEAVSVAMGRDRLKDHITAGAEIITGSDMSCLMHLQGLAERARMPVRFAHIAEIFAESVT